MLKLSERSEVMPASAIRRLVPYAEAAKKKGIKVYHLNIGQPDIKTPENAIEALKKYDGKIIEYTHSAGLESYRKGLAKYYQNIGIDVKYDDILITAGGSEAILFTLFVAFNQGEEIIIPEPYYTNYNGFSQMADVKVVPVESKIENGFALPKIEDFEAKLSPKTKGILICNPGNPTGAMYSREELKKLAEFAKKHDLLIIADEVYREFVYDGLKHTSVLELEDIQDNVVMVDSVSKRYSECGTRIGCMVSKNKEIIERALKYAQARLSPPYFGQILAKASLETPQEYFDEVYKEYVARRNFLIEELNKIDGVFAPMPKGAFYAMAKLPIDDSDKFCQWMLEEFSYDNQTVMMAPATGFYSVPEKGKKQVRLAYVLKIDDLKKAVKCLEAGLKKYQAEKM